MEAKPDPHPYPEFPEEEPPFVPTPQPKDVNVQLKKAVEYLNKATKFLIVVGEEILEDTEWIRPKGTMALWEKFPEFKHKMIDEVYSQKL